MQKITLEACAKINLTLHVTGIRADGYHLLDTVMHETGLCDTIEAEKTAKGITLEAPADLPQGMDNTIYKAALLYLDTARNPGGVRIRLTKRIPERAGLGGGSSDAGYTLRALDTLYGALGPDALLETARRTGADVPFFLTGKTARCTGTGDIIRPANAAMPLHLVLLCPEAGLGTPDVYREYDRLHKPGSGSSASCVEALEKADLPALCRATHNDLEAAACRLDPAIELAKEALLETGALAACMSGSGTSVFGLFTDSNNSHQAAESISQRDAKKYRLIHWQ